MYEDAKIKIELFCNKYPEIKLKILYKDDLIGLGIMEK